MPAFSSRSTSGLIDCTPAQAIQAYIHMQATVTCAPHCSQTRLVQNRNLEAALFEGMHAVSCRDSSELRRVRTNADMAVAASVLGPLLQIQRVRVGQHHQMNHLTACHAPDCDKNVALVSRRIRDSFCVCWPWSLVLSHCVKKGRQHNKLPRITLPDRPCHLPIQSQAPAYGSLLSGRPLFSSRPRTPW